MPCARGCCGSYREHLLSVSVSAAATPTRNPEFAKSLESRKVFDEDAAAYRRLRKDGLQPERVDGCAALETKAESTVEIEHGRLMPKPLVRAFEEMS